MWKVVLLVSLLVGGCKTLPEAQVNISANLLQECPALVLLDGTKGSDLARNINENAALYHQCKDMHSALVQAVKAK